MVVDDLVLHLYCGLYFVGCFLLLLFVLCFALSACTVGPDYQEPAVFENAQIAQALKLTGRDLSISEQWYRQFNDDCLNTLIADSLNNSPTIKSGIEKSNISLTGAPFVRSFIISTSLRDIISEIFFYTKYIKRSFPYD